LAYGAVLHKLDYPLPARSIGAQAGTGIKRASMQQARVQNRPRSQTIERGAVPSQERHRILTSSKSSQIVRLSPEDFIHSVLSREPAVAVFDCDGTLWEGDSGYDFMIWSIEEGIVSRNASDWIDSRYRLYRAGKVSELAMCGEMVQIYDGLSELEVRRAAAAFFESRFVDKVFAEMRSLTDSLTERGTEIWVVSSTNNWVIEEGVRSFKIPPSRVISARAEVVDGIITSNLIDVPTGEGKARSLIAAGVAAPDVVFGNSIHDAAMLEIAGQAYAVNPTPALLQIATRQGWRVFYPEAILPV
jgi:phosphoserine phosphatase